MAKTSANENNTLSMIHEPQWILCFYFFALAILAKTSQYLLKPIFKLTNRPSSNELSLRNKMHAIRKEQQGLSIKDNFAAHSKFQRQLNVLEDELKQIVQERLEKNVKIKLMVQYGFDIFISILLVFSIIYTRKIPLMILKQNLYPFESLFSYPSDVPHAITSHAWVIISRVSIEILLKATVKISEFQQRNNKSIPETVS